MQNDNDNIAKVANQKSMKRILLGHIGSLLVVPIIILMIEYWTGLFADKEPFDIPNNIKSVNILFFSLIYLLLTKEVFRILFRSKDYVREEFAFLGIVSILIGLLSFLFCLIARQTPWQAISNLYYFLAQNKTTTLTAHWSEHAFLFLLWILISTALWFMHFSWRGGKSIDQYQRDTKGISTNIFEDAYSELQRLKNRTGRHEFYTTSREPNYQSQLSPVSYSRAWKDQSVELLRLTTSSYIFDTDKNWQDSMGCWYGVNTDDDSLVILFPIQGNIKEKDIDRYRENVKILEKSKNLHTSEVILAIKKNENIKFYIKRYADFRFETEESLLDQLINFNDYRNEIFKRVKNTKLSESELTLDQTYVPSKITYSNDVGECFDLEEFMSDWLLETSNKHLALLGEYGQGKSTAALMFTYKLLFDKDFISGRIPILIELRGMSPRNLSPLNLLGAWAAQYNINPQALMKLHIAGRTLLIFEGFDEMALVGDSQMRLKHFNTLWQFSFPKSKILITGRPNFFLDEEELKASLGISKPIGERPYCEAVRLIPFTLEQAEMSLRNQPELIKTQIIGLAKLNPRFFELASRPALLHIISVLWEREDLIQKAGQLNSAYIMDMFIRYSYRRQGVKETDSSEFMALTTSERAYFMGGIAAYMIANELPNQISNIQLNDAIERLFDSIPESVSTTTSRIYGETSTPLKIRTRDDKFGLDHIKTDVRTCGILVDDVALPDSFKFGHKSFMEYLFASTVFDFIIKKDPIAKSILNAVDTNVYVTEKLPVAMDFLGEMVESKLITQTNKANDEIFAKGLLSILLNNQDKPYLSKLALFNSAFRVPDRYSKYVNTSNLNTPAVWLYFFSGMGVSLILGVTIFSGRINKPYIYPQLLFLAFSFIIFIISLMTLKVSLTSRLEFALWNRICKRVGISDSILHKIAFTWWIPWMKNKEFNFLISNED